MFFDEMKNTFSIFVHISKKEGGGVGGEGMEIVGSIINSKIFPNGKLNYSVLIPFPFGDAPSPFKTVYV